MENLKFTSRTQSYKDLKISYLGGVAISSKLVHSKSVNVATYGVYLAPYDLSGYNVCPNSKHCKDTCLFKSGHAMMEILAGKNKIVNSRIKKTKLFFENKELFMEILISEIASAKKVWESKGFFFSVRLNCTSDIDINKFNYKGKNICDIFPDVQFYDYTKVYSYLDNVYKYPNYDITYSYNGYNDVTCKKALERGFRIAVVFEKLPKMFNGYPVINGDNSDYRPMDGKNVVVGLKVKKTSTMVKDNKFVIPKNRFIVRYDDKRCKK